MKKYLMLAFIFAIAFTFMACGGSKKLGGTVKGKTYTTEGWVDDDTFRVAAAGAPKRDLTNKVQRRESAKSAATINAQAQVLEKFKGARIEGAAGMSDFESSGVAFVKEVEGVIQGGSVKNVTYDEDDNAEVIYEVKAKGLKGKVSSATWQ